MMLLEGIEREDHVVRGHRLAVMPFGVGPQTIGDEGKIVRVADGLGQRAVFGRDFVERGRREGFVNECNGAGDLPLHTGDDDVEIVECADGDLARDAAFGRFRIDVVEALEVRGVLDLSEQRQRVAPGERTGRLRVRHADRKAPYGTEGGERGGSSAGEQEIASGNGQINIPVLKEATPLRSQYRRGFDGICCFFLILEGRTAIRCGQTPR
ncbi:hypothetical protein ACVW1A_003659 [Bradyrhizobium sp. LB1.3]